jgi:hypothetical protein
MVWPVLNDIGTINSLLIALKKLSAQMPIFSKKRLVYWARKDEEVAQEIIDVFETLNHEDSSQNVLSRKPPNMTPHMLRMSKKPLYEIEVHK